MKIFRVKCDDELDNFDPEMTVFIFHHFSPAKIVLPDEAPGFTNHVLVMLPGLGKCPQIW